MNGGLSAEVDYGAAISPVDCANIVRSGRSTRDGHERGRDKLSGNALRRAAGSRERPTSNSCRGLSGRRRPRWHCGRLRARGSSTCMCWLWPIGSTTCMPPGCFWRLSTDVRFAPEAAVPGITQTDLVARPRQVNTPNFSSSRALAALDLMIYQLNYVGPKISRVGNDRLLKRIRRRHWVFGAVVRPRFGLLGVG
jgi:hypothetical protein